MIEFRTIDVSNRLNIASFYALRTKYDKYTFQTNATTLPNNTLNLKKIHNQSNCFESIEFIIWRSHTEFHFKSFENTV
jgi:hypothetical protein